MNLTLRISCQVFLGSIGLLWLSSSISIAQLSDLPPVKYVDKGTIDRDTTQRMIGDLLNAALTSGDTETQLKMLQELNAENGLCCLRVLNNHLELKRDPVAKKEIQMTIQRIAGSQEPVTLQQIERLMTESLFRPFFADFSEIQEYKNLRRLELQTSTTLNQDLKNLAQLNKLEHLGISQGVNDEGLMEIFRLQGLNSLTIGESMLMDQSFSEIHRLQKLKRLDISGCRAFCGSGLEAISKLPLLEELSLPSSIEGQYLKQLINSPSLHKLNLFGGIHKDSVCDLKNVPRLQTIRWEDARLSKQDYVYLSQQLLPITLSVAGMASVTQNSEAIPESKEEIRMRQVRSAIESLRPFEVNSRLDEDGDVIELDLGLSYFSRNLTDRNMRGIQAMTNLRSLNITYAPITDLGLMEISNLRRLEKIFLSEHITDLGLEQLVHNKYVTMLHANLSKITDAGVGLAVQNFRFLNVISLPPSVTDQGAANLNELQFLKNIYFNGSQISVAGLSPLQQLPRLKSLVCSNSKFSESEIRQLKAMFPHVQLSVRKGN